MPISIKKKLLHYYQYVVLTTYDQAIGYLDIAVGSGEKYIPTDNAQENAKDS